jgi:hypothetical protein
MHLYIALSLILLSSVNTVSTVSPPPSFQEQTNFGIEDPVFDRPIDLPDAALPALRADDRVLSCEHTPDNGDPQSHWFIASKIHLAGRGEHDLIVETRHGGRNHKLGNSCLYGANIGPFWVLRFHDSRYEVVLSISALGLNILPSKHNHFKDIETGAVIGNRYVSTLIFHFDGAKYVQAGVRNELIEGAPKDCDQ